MARWRVMVRMRAGETTSAELDRMTRVTESLRATFLPQ
jgi:hypothetical protein